MKRKNDGRFGSTGSVNTIAIMILSSLIAIQDCYRSSAAPQLDMPVRLAYRKAKLNLLDGCGD